MRGAGGMPASLRVLLAVLLLASGEALLQVHTRLAAAILQRARVDAVAKREGLLEEAERLLGAAAEIDDALRKLGEDAVPPAPPKTQSPEPPAAAGDDDGARALARLGAAGKLARIVDFAGESAEVVALDGFDVAADAPLYLLAWSDAAAARASGVRFDDSLSALVVGSSGADVLVALTREDHARQVAHFMTTLDGFPMRAVPVTAAAAAAVVFANNPVRLGVIVDDG